MLIPFWHFLRAGFRDHASLFWALAVPMALMAALRLFASDPQYLKETFVGLLAMGLFFLTAFGLAFETMSLRRHGLFRLLKLTPFGILRMVGVLVAARAVGTLLIAIVLTSGGIILLQAEVTAPVLAAWLPIMALGVAIHMGFGITLALGFARETSLSLAANGLLLPMVLLSDAFWSLKSGPPWLARFSHALPFQAWLDALRGATQGHEILLPCGILLAWGILIALVLLRLARWAPRAGRV